LSPPAHAAASLRPGIAAGPYPERRDEPEGALERLARGFAGVFPRRRRRRAGAAAIVARVHAAAAELAALSDEALQREAVALRARLHREGFTAPLAGRAFALVQESAHRRLGLRHYDVQLAGGWVLLQGCVAEMETGEGKTLTATLPACTAAMAGIPVHVITVNDYLAARDARGMEPLYRALGLSVGAVTAGMDPQARRAAYRCDVVYCTNKQLVFDYLADRLRRGTTRGDLRTRLDGLLGGGESGAPFLRGLCFALVDEADSVLVDEARTPVILSASRDAGDLQTYVQALAFAEQLAPGPDYAVDTRERRVHLTEGARARIERLTAHLGGPWAIPPRRDELVRQALAAQHLFHRDHHYLVR